VTIGHSFFGFISFTRTDPEQTELANYIQNDITNKLINAGYFQIISGKQVEHALEAGQIPPCDVYIAGALTGFDVDITSEKTDKFDKNGYPIYSYKKMVSFTMTYQVINSSSGVVYYTYTNNFSGFDTASDRKSLRSTKDIIQYSLGSCTSDLMKKLQPYEITLYLTLLDNKENEDMEAAKTLVKNKQYRAAQEKYNNIYSATGLFEACYNSAMILEIMGEYEQARAQLEALFNETFDTRASKAIQGIDTEIMYRDRLGAQQAARM